MAFDPTIHLQIMCHIRDTIRTLKSQLLQPLRITEDEVKIREKPWTDEKIFEGITIHPEQEELGSGTCSTDDIGYGCVVTYARQSGGHAEDDNLDRVVRFRSEIRSRFNRNTMPVGCVFTCGVEPASFLLPRQYQQNYKITSLLLRPWSEEERQ